MERRITVPLSGLQRFLYSALLKRDLGELLQAGTATGGVPARAPEIARLNGRVMQLRKVWPREVLAPLTQRTQRARRLYSF